MSVERILEQIMLSTQRQRSILYRLDVAEATLRQMRVEALAEEDIQTKLRQELRNEVSRRRVKKAMLRYLEDTVRVRKRA